MKYYFIALIALVLWKPISGFGQPITWDLEDVDTTVTAGSNVQIYAHLFKSDAVVYACAASVTNVNLPAGWYYTLCNPFVCLTPDNSETTFNYPDMINYDFDNEGHGIEAIKVAVYTTPGNAVLMGELDLTFENVTTGDVFTNHIIVRTNGESLSIEENNAAAKPMIYPVPVSDELQILNCTAGTFYAILDVSGRELTNGITSGNIDCSQLNSGNYYLQIVQEGQISNRMFQKR